MRELKSDRFGMEITQPICFIPKNMLKSDRFGMEIFSQNNKSSIA